MEKDTEIKGVHGLSRTFDAHRESRGPQCAPRLRALGWGAMNPSVRNRDIFDETAPT